MLLCLIAELNASRFIQHHFHFFCFKAGTRMFLSCDLLLLCTILALLGKQIRANSSDVTDIRRLDVNKRLRQNSRKAQRKRRSRKHHIIGWIYTAKTNILFLTSLHVSSSLPPVCLVNIMQNHKPSIFTNKPSLGNIYSFSNHSKFFSTISSCKKMIFLWLSASFDIRASLKRCPIFVR